MHRCTPQAHPELARPDDGWRLPEVGDTVGYRPVCDVDPIEVTVVEVDMDDEDRDDGNVWGVPDEEGRILPAPGAPRDDKVLRMSPNPNVTLRTPDGGVVVTRHVRYANSPGWCWPDQGS